MNALIYAGFILPNRNTLNPVELEVILPDKVGTLPRLDGTTYEYFRILSVDNPGRKSMRSGRELLLTREPVKYNPETNTPPLDALLLHYYGQWFIDHAPPGLLQNNAQQLIEKGIYQLPETQ